MRKKRFTFIDAFAGVGGFHYGVKNALQAANIDCECLAAIEWDKDAAAVYEDNHGIKPLGDITKISIEEVPAADILTGGFPCFAAGTMIFTESGYKPIEDVAIGERVLTHTRQWKRIVQKHTTENRQLRLIKGCGYLSLKTTDEHPFYTRTRIYRWNKTTKQYDISFSTPAFVPAKDIKGSHIGVTFPTEIIDDDRSTDYWWLIGRCLADGWCVRRKGRGDGGYVRVVLCCGKHEFIEDKIAKVFPVVSKVEERTAFKYHITHKSFAQEFSKAGIGAANKHIPNQWLCLPIEKLSALLDGYFSGDGHTFMSKKTGLSCHSCITVSPKLILTLQMALLKCRGLLPSLRYEQRPVFHVIESRTVNQKSTYTARFYDHSRSNHIEGGYGWGLCRKSDLLDEHATVYNIAVEDDESYIANGAIVHNCQPFSASGSNQRLRGGDVSGDDRSNLFLYLVKYLEIHKPKVFVFENVAGIMTAKNADGSLIIETIKQYIKDAEYKLYMKELSPHQFGVPQHRPRIIFVGIRNDIDRGFTFPQELNTPCAVKDIMDLTLTTGDFYNKAKTMNNQILPGTKLDALVENYKLRTPTRKHKPLHTNLLCEINNDTPSTRSRQSDRVYSIEGVSPTITASKLLAPFELVEGDPTSWRYLTEREVFNLQSFPQSFKMSASSTKAHKQAGNAVNVRIVEIIVGQLLKQVLEPTESLFVYEQEEVE